MLHIIKMLYNTHEIIIIYKSSHHIKFCFIKFYEIISMNYVKLYDNYVETELLYFAIK